MSVVFVKGTCFVNDAQRVDQGLTAPIETAAAKLSENTRLSSTTSPIGTLISAEFEDNLTSADAEDILVKQIEQNVQLPQHC